MKNTSNKEFDAHQKDLAISYCVIETAKFEGKELDRLEGMEKEKTEVVIKAFKNKIPVR